jgi:hypothetical protein
VRPVSEAGFFAALVAELPSATAPRGTNHDSVGGAARAGESEWGSGWPGVMAPLSHRRVRLMLIGIGTGAR